MVGRGVGKGWMVVWEPRTAAGEVADCAGEMGTRSRVGVPIEREIGASTITHV